MGQQWTLGDFSIIFLIFVFFSRCFRVYMFLLPRSYFLLLGLNGLKLYYFLIPSFPTASGIFFSYLVGG